MDIQTRAARDRLLSSANVARMRGDFDAMEKACRDIIALTGEDADVLELLGDALFGQENFKEARDTYKKASEIAPGKASAECKYARTVLIISEQQRESESSMHGISACREKPRRKTAAGAGCLSMLFPGLGQLITGQYVKGGIILGSFLVSLVALSLLPDTEAFFRSLGIAFGLSSPAYGDSPAKMRVGIWFVFFSGVAAFCYVYSVIDAFVEGAKELVVKITSEKDSRTRSR